MLRGKPSARTRISTPGNMRQKTLCKLFCFFVKYMC
nr:MAG TPA: hypothetical protein [Caudoviricetes sp.]